MAQELNKKFLDAAGLYHFWEKCRLHSDGNFKTNIEIFNVMAAAIEDLRERAGVDQLPDNIQSIFELVEKQAIVGFKTNYTTGVITYTTMDSKTHTFDILKLYEEKGNNTDGTMTQKAITDELNKKVGVTFDDDTKTLIFTND